MQEVCKNGTSDSNMLRNLPPTTRYQGSKRSILPWLSETFNKLSFETVLDGFGGTGSVSYLLKSMKKQVCFNDFLLSNYYIGLALIENSHLILSKDDLDFILRKNEFYYPSFIEDNFGGVYYLDHENRWLDTVVHNIMMLSEKYEGETLRMKRAIAFFALFQACLCKRPFNLFHRKNLNLRLANVTRRFGNKTTWDTDFEKLFLRFNEELSSKIFSNGQVNRAECSDVHKFKEANFDLVYFDPPYTRPNGKAPQDYFSLYHFLEGLVDYENWSNKIDLATRNKCLFKGVNMWDSNPVEKNFDQLFRKFQDSIILVSYGEPGYPPINKIKELLLQYKSQVEVKRTNYKYKLNRKNGEDMYEVLIIGN